MHVSATVDCCHVAEQIAGNPFIEVRKILCNSWNKPFLRRTCDTGLTTNANDKQTRDRDTADCRDQGLDGANYAAHTSKMVGRLELEAEANAGMDF